MGKTMEQEFFKARITFFFCVVQYRGPQLLTGKYKHLCSKTRIITTGMVILRIWN